MKVLGLGLRNTLGVKLTGLGALELTELGVKLTGLGAVAFGLGVKLTGLGADWLAGLGEKLLGLEKFEKLVFMLGKQLWLK